MPSHASKASKQDTVDRGERVATCQPSDDLHSRPFGPICVAFWIAVAALVVVGTLLGCRQITSPDLGWHLSYARWIVDNGTVPSTDPLTYTVSDRSAIDPQWLFQLVLAGVMAIGGTTAIVLTTTAATLVFGGVLFLRAWRREGRLPLAASTLLLLFFLGNTWEIRPHLASWLLGSVLLLVMENRSQRSTRWLQAVPLIMLLWVNMHSLFILGLVILGAYVAADGVKAVRDRRRMDMALVRWSCAGMLSCLVNPYHVKALALPFVQFLDIQGEGGFKSPASGIAEFMSPFRLDIYETAQQIPLFQAGVAWHLFTVLALIGVVMNWRRLGLADIVLFIGFLYIFWSAQKNFGYFVMVSLPLAAGGLERVSEHLCRTCGMRTPDRNGIWRAIRPGCVYLAGFVILCTVVVAAVATGWFYDVAWSKNRSGFTFNSSVLPVGACEFLNRHDIDTRILNTWNHGGYISWATGQKVFIYGRGRVMGLDFYRQYVDAKQPGHFAQALKRWQPGAVLVQYEVVPYWLYYLNRHEDWRLVYSSTHTAVFLHRTVEPGVPAMPQPRPGEDYRDYDEATMVRIIERAVAADEATFLQRLQGSGLYPDEAVARSGLYFQTGQLDASIGVSLTGLTQCPYRVPELLLTLGHALDARGRYRLADRCFDAFLESRNDPAMARDIHRVRRHRR